MNNEYVDVIIAVDGTVKVETKGFKGDACYKATGALEAALGKKLAVAQTPEFNKTERAVRRAGGSS